MLGSNHSVRINIIFDGSRDVNVTGVGCTPMQHIGLRSFPRTNNLIKYIFSSKALHNFPSIVHSYKKKHKAASQTIRSSTNRKYDQARTEIIASIITRALTLPSRDNSPDHSSSDMDIIPDKPSHLLTKSRSSGVLYTR
jgi:hypothetical protein